MVDMNGTPLADALLNLGTAPQVGRIDCSDCDGYGHREDEECATCHGSGSPICAGRSRHVGCRDVATVNDDGVQRCEACAEAVRAKVSIEDIELHRERGVRNGKRYTETYAIVTWSFAYSGFVTTSEVSYDLERADRSVGYAGGVVTYGKNIPRAVEDAVVEAVELDLADESEAA